MTLHPFRFIAPMPKLTPDLGAWQASLRRIEDLGFSTIAISEHLTGGWSMEPLVTLAAAAGVTNRMRLLTLVLANDFHHPVLLHKAIATLDVLSGGRVELGLGTGWLAADYDASGIAMEPIGRRITRLAESITVLKGLFGPLPVTFAGTHYTISALTGLPAPIQQPHPPLLIGGGGPRILGLAAKQADIVGIHARLGEGTISASAAADLDADRIAEKIGLGSDRRGSLGSRSRRSGAPVLGLPVSGHDDPTPRYGSGFVIRERARSRPGSRGALAGRSHRDGGRVRRSTRRAQGAFWVELLASGRRHRGRSAHRRPPRLGLTAQARPADIVDSSAAWAARSPLTNASSVQA